MSLKFFVDHCVPKSIYQRLMEVGYEIQLLKDHLPTDSSDLTVITKAQELDAILLSLNSDFADIISYPPENYKGIIALQIKNHPETIPQLINNLLTYLSTHPQKEHYHGKLILVDAYRIRIRE